MQEDDELEPPTPHYINLPHVEAPTGYVAVANFDQAGSERETFLVPASVAAQLRAAWLSADARRAGFKAVANAELAKIEKATPASSATGSSGAPSSSTFKRRSEHTVDATAFSTGWPRPRGRGWVRLWQPERLLAAVEAHNKGLGSFDRGDVARDAALLRRVLEHGPWRRCAAPRDGESVVRQLEDEFGHLRELVRLVADRLALSHASRQPFGLSPLLLVGPPGVGKSHFALRLAEILGLPASSIDMSNQQTNSFLHGSDRHWSNARPGLLCDLLLRGTAGAAPVANPVVVIDELDKASGPESYDPLAPLHLALEPATARRTLDLCAHIEFDASRVIYIATANSLAHLPASLLSRFRLILVGPPEPRHALSAAARIAARLIGEAGLTRRFAPVGHPLLALLADRNPREIVQLLGAALARAVAAGRMHLEKRDIDPDDPTDAARRLH